MSRLIILEGPDGSGKTALARRLQHVYGYGYIHTGPPKPDEDVLLSYALTLYHAYHSKKDYVIDRLHLGETIYGPVLRWRDRLGKEGLTILERMIQGYGARVVICLPPFEVARENWSGNLKNEYLGDLDKYSLIYNTYESLLKARNFTRWDYTANNTQHFVELQEVLDTCPDHVIGSPCASYLIIGEKANQKELDVPWVSLAGSSHYLYECLHDAGYQEHEMAFVNALQLDGRLNPLPEIWKQLRHPIPIMLGKVARHSMSSCPINADCVLHHPAYWQRFHSNERDTYVERLRKIRHHSS